MTLDESSTQSVSSSRTPVRIPCLPSLRSVHRMTFSSLLSLPRLSSYILTFRQHALNFKARSPFLPSTQQPVQAFLFPSSPQIKPMTMENSYGFSFVPFFFYFSHKFPIYQHPCPQRKHRGKSHALKNMKFRSQGWENEIPWDSSFPVNVSRGRGGGFLGVN